MSELPPGFRWFPPRLTHDEHRFVVHGEYYWQLLRYDTGRGVTAPHVTTLCGPSGRNVLEVSPVDHLHHRGLWWGHGDVNGVDYYLELPGGEVTDRAGTIAHLGWIDVVDDAPRFGFVEELAWRDDHGHEVIRERRSLQLHVVPDADHLTVDLDSIYTAVTDLTFGDTKESVLPGIRPAEALTGALGGTITNSEGATGEQATFGRPARWVDVSGLRRAVHVGTEGVEGIAILDHPDNPDHPSRYFTREYGPLSPFPGHHFHERRSLEAGGELRLRHRLVVHAGTAEEADIDGHWQRYATDRSPIEEPTP